MSCCFCGEYWKRLRSCRVSGLSKGGKIGEREYFPLWLFFLSLSRCGGWGCKNGTTVKTMASSSVVKALPFMEDIKPSLEAVGDICSGESSRRPSCFLPLSPPVQVMAAWLGPSLTLSQAPERERNPFFHLSLPTASSPRSLSSPCVLQKLNRFLVCSLWSGIGTWE